MAAKGAGYGLGVACFALVAAVAGAAQFKVGGDGGWSVPGASAESYNTWAMKNRFQIGDALEFVYPKEKDSVLLVEPASYNACNTTAYVRRFDDGDTVFTLDRSGALFFISGVEANCRANEKLIVMVLAGRNGTGAGRAPPPSSSSSSPPPVASTMPPPASSPPPSSASSPPPATPPPAPAPKAPSPASGSAPPPVSAPTTPTSPPPASSPPAPPSSSPPAPSSTPSGPAGAPPSSANAPSAAAGGPTTNWTGTPSSSPPPAGPKDRNSAVLTAAAAGSAVACVISYAMLAL